MAKQEELTRFYMSNKELKDSAGNVDKSAIKDWNAQVRQMTSALESATNGLVKVIKTIDENGKALATFDVKRSQAGNAQPAFNRVLGNIETRYGYQAGSLAKDPYATGLNQAEDFRRIAFYKSFHGADAKRAAKEAMEAVGGIAVSDPSRKLRDRMRLEFSVSEAEWAQALQNAGGDATKATSSISSSFVGNNLKKAESYSRDVTTNKREREKAKEEAKEKAEAEKAQKAQLKAIEKDKKEKDAASLKNARLIQKMEADAAKEEARQKAKKEKEEARQKVKEERESKANRRKMLHWLTIVVSFLSGIADITRRILTASLARASEIKKEQVDAKSLGISYTNTREYKAQETAMGMKEGAFTSAIASLQSAFGDVTHLDDNALGELAKVLKGDVVEAINNGLGRSDPEKLMKTILNTYYERGQSGINSIGQQVGRYQAERELATALEKAGLNDLADVLRNMFYTNDTGIYKGRISNGDSFADYMGLSTAYTMGYDAIDNRHFAELGQVVDSVKSKFQSLKDSLNKLVLDSIGGLIQKIDNWDIGKSAEEKLKDTRTNIQLNAAARDRLQNSADIARRQYTQMFSEAGINAADFGIKGVNTIDEFLAFTNTSEGQYWNPKGEQAKEAYNNLVQFLNTEQGNEAIKLVHYTQTAEKKAKQADEAYKKGLKTGKVAYNKADYTASAIATDMKKNLPDSWFSNEFSAVNLLYRSGRGDNARKALFTNQEVWEEYKRSYLLGKPMTYETALASGDANSLTNALYDRAKASYKSSKKWDKEKQKMGKEALVKQALKDGVLTNDDVEGLVSQNVSTSGWGISLDAGSIIRDALITRGLKEFAEQAEVNNVLSEALGLQGAKDFLAKHNAESVVATVGGYSEKEGRVNVVLSIKGGDKGSPKEVLSFYTDSVLGENKVYPVDLGNVVNSGQNMEATR